MSALADAVQRVLDQRWGGIAGRDAAEHFGLGVGRNPQQLLKNWLQRGVPSGRVPLLIRGLPADRQREVARAELRERLGGISEAYLTVLRLWTADDSVVRLVSAALRCEQGDARDWLALAA